MEDVLTLKVGILSGNKNSMNMLNTLLIEGWGIYKFYPSDCSMSGPSFDENTLYIFELVRDNF
jgi:hypothetical protein